MKKLEMVITVDENGLGSFAANGDIPPGRHKAVVILEDDASKTKRMHFLTLPPLSLGPWKEGLTFSRDELYGDNE